MEEAKNLVAGLVMDQDLRGHPGLEGQAMVVTHSRGHRDRAMEVGEDGLRDDPKDDPGPTMEAKEVRGEAEVRFLDQQAFSTCCQLLT